MKLNFQQSVVLTLAVIGMGLACFEVPWKKTFHSGGLKYEQPLGYFPLFEEPKPSLYDITQVCGAEVDLQRAALPIVFVIFFSITGVWLTASRQASA